MLFKKENRTIKQRLPKEARPEDRKRERQRKVKITIINERNTKCRKRERERKEKGRTRAERKNKEAKREEQEKQRKSRRKKGREAERRVLLAWCTAILFCLVSAAGHKCSDAVSRSLESRLPSGTIHTPQLL